jgi:F-type H+-transporting ATPase subunit gamma
MATTREIRRRIISTRNTQKITKAMEMVSSVKLRKARAQILSARPYAEKLADIASHLSGSGSAARCALLAPRDVKKINLVVISSDKGMCGGFNTNVIKKAMSFIRENEGTNIALTIVGKKAAEFFKRKNVPIANKYTDVFIKPVYADAAKIGEKILSDFLSGAVDEVYMAYNEFKSSAAQNTRLIKILPVPPPQSSAKTGTAYNYIFEPDDVTLLTSIASRYFVIQMWRAFLESFASEQGARMAAMNGATKNAGELIGKFTLWYNKARQAAITKELLEVVGGAESLR